MSLEVIYPKTKNVIPYDKSIIQFTELLSTMPMAHQLVQKEKVQEC